MSNTSRPETSSGAPSPTARPNHFIEDIIEADNASLKWGAWGTTHPDRADTPKVHTRFPPEPNGYLHIGHAKSILLNFSLARKYHGKFNLRFDDTNPAKEEREYVDSITRDVLWLGAEYLSPPTGGGLFFASNYFEQMYAFAEELVLKGKAYVCQLSADEVAKRRGAPGVPATSPHRDRPADESLRLLREMRDGTHPDGAMTLRAKIDLASPNFNLRDPVLYRISHQHHHNTADRWCIYPMYDWAHGFEDSIEGITHSICTLEFENHRPLYDWFIDAVNDGRPPEKKIHHPQQIEFAKLRPTYTIMSKRNLLKMVESGVVHGWDDPRMPTLSGLRRRGFTPQAIRAFCEDIGVTKVESSIDLARLENAVRDHLNRVAPRRMAVLRPLRVVIENYPDDRTESFDCINNPEDPAAGSRPVPFARELFIEHDDFSPNPPKGYFRLAPGQEVRLRWAYFIRATRFDTNPDGSVSTVYATYDPDTRGGDAPPNPDGSPGRKVKGTIHWVSARHALDATVRLIDRLFTAEAPGERTGNYTDDLNPDSLITLHGCKLEPDLANARVRPNAENGCTVGDRVQFERLGYFCVDQDSTPSTPVFNRTISLKDSWAKAAAKSPQR